MSKEGKASRTIVVTGDFTIDWNIARIRRDDISGNSWNPNDRTRACWQRGGAALLGDLIETMAADLKGKKLGEFTVNKISDMPESACPADERFHHSYAQWSLFNYKEKEGPEPRAWRVVRVHRPRPQRERLGRIHRRAGQGLRGARPDRSRRRRPRVPRSSRTVVPPAQEKQ